MQRILVNGYKFEFTQKKNEIKECFSVSEQHLDNLWLQSNKPSANYVLFQEFRKTVRELINMVQINPQDSMK